MLEYCLEPRSIAAQENLLVLQEYCLELERRFLPKLGNWWDPDPGAGALLHIFLAEYIRSSETLEP